ncbi:hypothetical protein TVNIR_1197 [Thioalkalivibrio nitratireducens DSM 14787]|uniref:Uncharacterized protein n=1 Tax=Thioalkalivibrio nitratireducens (strain DSM 14787 / UNIQEM 213 / ALEN2) TaxID=1255043 RepID=L0DV49_THIND|nr:hypothetical protein TVNIR_1197 [Thioalkalivibrio nitratireducens DSM 14787]
MQYPHCEAITQQQPEPDSRRYVGQNRNKRALSASAHRAPERLAAHRTYRTGYEPRIR